MIDGKGTMNELTNQSVTDHKKLAECVKYLRIELPVIPKYNSEFMCFEIIRTQQTKFDFERKPFGVSGSKTLKKRSNNLKCIQYQML